MLNEKKLDPYKKNKEGKDIIDIVNEIKKMGIDTRKFEKSIKIYETNKLFESDLTKEYVEYYFNKYPKQTPDNTVNNKGETILENMFKFGGKHVTVTEKEFKAAKYLVYEKGATKIGEGFFDALKSFRPDGPDSVNPQSQEVIDFLDQVHKNRENAINKNKVHNNRENLINKDMGSAITEFDKQKQEKKFDNDKQNQCSTKKRIIKPMVVRGDSNIYNRRKTSNNTSLLSRH